MGIIAAAEAATSSSKGSSSMTFLLLIVVVFVGFYFLMIRPQRRRQQQAAQQQNTVAPGARVRTTAGMYATVVATDGDDVVLEVAPGVEVRYLRRAIMEVISPGEQAEAEDAEPEAYDGTEPEAYADAEPEAEGTDEPVADVASAEDGLAGSHDQHDDLAKSDKN